MADIKLVFDKICQKFRLKELNKFQKEAIEWFATKDRDVFVNLPTGAGKSMTFLALPTAYNILRGKGGHIVVVVSPLISLMDDQVYKLKQLGIQAVSLSSIKEDEVHILEQGLFEIVFGTPESWLKNERWRRLLSSPLYHAKTCGIAVDEAHVIKQWGTSNSNNFVAFREVYGKLHEFRALVPCAKVLALTATATKLTREIIVDVMHMDNPVIVSESPSKPNIAYSVTYLPKDLSVVNCFQWLIDELKEHGKSTERTIIYCQTIKQATHIYSTIKAMLGEKLYSQRINDRRHTILEMLHACTPKANKELILSSFQDTHGEIRVLVATIAFGMGIDCKGVHRIIHFGPSKNVEAYIQESGRAGRDNEQSVAYILYKGLMLNHVEKDIKGYLKCTSCRRTSLLHHFDLTSEIEAPKPLHLCCDNCAKDCSCGKETCGELIQYPGIVSQVCSENSGNTENRKSREVTKEQEQSVYRSLTAYHKSLLKDIVKKHRSTLKLSNIKFMLGFSDVQIDQVVENCHRIFTEEDVEEYVEVWDFKHINVILNTIAETFADIPYVNREEHLDLSASDSLVFDENIDIEWEDLIQDDELFDLAVENLSVTLSEYASLEVSNVSDLPDAASNALEDLDY